VVVSRDSTSHSRPRTDDHHRRVRWTHDPPRHRGAVVDCWFVHVVVVGCGRVGSELAAQLERSGHSVAIIDKRADAFRRLPGEFTGQRVLGFGFDRDHLVDAGVQSAGAVAAVTSGDNSNILTARIARETFGVERVVARIYDPRRALIYQRLGISTVATVAWTVDQVVRRLIPSDVPSEWTDPSNSLMLIARPIPTSWIGQKLAGVSEPGRFQLAAVSRFGTAFVPGPTVVGQEGDELHFSVAIGDVAALDARLVEGPEH